MLDTDGNVISGFIIKSLAGYLVPDLPTTSDQNDPGLPLSFFTISTEIEASAQFFADSFFPDGAITGIVNLGQFFNPDGSVALLSDLDITYTVLNTVGIFNGDCIGCHPDPQPIPEPSSIVLLVMGLAIYRWRPRRTV